MQPTTRSANQPLGGGSGAWGHRVLRFHVPLALASIVVLVLFMRIPLFDANAYPHADMFSGPVPQAGGEDRSMNHNGSQTDSSRHGRSQSDSMQHGTDRSGAMDHGAGQATDHTAGSDEGGGRSFIRRFTVGTGYIALGLLAFTLLIGPATLLLRRRNPISSYLRRDAGAWTAILSLVHVIAGFQVHGTGQLLDYFVAPDNSLLTNSFGLGNWTGLAATLLGVGLLAISSNVALRKLKARPWKRLQRLNYTLFVLVILHAFFYGALVRLESPYTLLLLLSLSIVVAEQAVGVWLWRRRHGRGRTMQQEAQATDATG